MKLDPFRIVRYYYLRVKRLKGTPYSLAMGTAIGVAVGITPTLPLHTIAIISLTLLLRVNTIVALIACTLISNPLTFALHYYAAWKVGNWIFPGKLSWERLQELLQTLRESDLLDGLRILSHLSVDAISVMLSGGIVLAFFLGVPSYFLAHWFFSTIQERRTKKHLLN